MSSREFHRLTFHFCSAQLSSFSWPENKGKIVMYENRICNQTFKCVYMRIEILYNKEICNLQLKKRRFIRLCSKFYYKSGQWSADFITVVRVHKPSSCPTDYIFCFHIGSYLHVLNIDAIWVKCVICFKAAKAEKIRIICVIWKQDSVRPICRCPSYIHIIGSFYLY